MLDIGTIVQGCSGLVALYLAIQIKRVIDNHEIRITTLEVKGATRGVPSSRRGPSRARPRRRRVVV